MLGLGAGLDYGGFGFNISFYPYKYVGAFVGWVILLLLSGTMQVLSFVTLPSDRVHELAHL